MHLVWAAVAILLASGCHLVLGDFEPNGSDARSGVDAAATDAASLDTSALDAAQLDAGLPDTGMPDATQLDAARPDTGQADTGQADTSMPDATQLDATLPDTGPPDTVLPDTALPDAALPDTALPDASPADLLHRDLSGVEVPYNLVFVSAASAVVGSDFQSPQEADSLCHYYASQADLDGTFVAWLSDGTRQARDELAGKRGWVRRDGLPVADTVEDLLSGEIYYPIAVDEHGQDVEASTRVFTNTAVDGSAVSSDPCGGWRPARGDLLTMGRASATTDSWTSDGTDVCSRSGIHLYCFQVDLSEPLIVEPQPGRLVFLSDQSFTPSGGYDTADQICQSDATNFLERDDFAALLAGVDGESASFRFSDDGRPWVRPDGIVVALAFDDLFEQRILAPTNVTLNNAAGERYLGKVEVWTGAASLQAAPGSVNEHCGGWDPGASTYSGLFGWANQSDSTRYDTNGATKPCSESGRIYCLEL